LLFTNLQAQGFKTGVRGPDKTSGVEEVAADEEGGFVDQSRLAQGDNAGGSPGEPLYRTSSTARNPLLIFNFIKAALNAFLNVERNSSLII